jgi:heat shock protein HslJ
VSADYVKTYNTNGVPVVQAPPPPPPPTATPVPPPDAMPQAGFWVDQTTITQGQCTTLRWQVDNVQAVYIYPAGANYQDYPVTGSGSRQVCPTTTTTYEMRIQLKDGSVKTLQVTVNVVPGNGLANTTWQVQSLYGAQTPVPGSSMTIFFSSANTTNGSGGCNQFNGPYTLNGSSLVIGPLATTQMMCDQSLMTQEQMYFQALASVALYEISGNQLILKTGAGQEVLRYTRVG